MLNTYVQKAEMKKKNQPFFFRLQNNFLLYDMKFLYDKKDIPGFCVAYDKTDKNICIT